MKALLRTAALLLLSTGSVAGADWQMDSKASRLEFTASYQGEAAPGAFRDFSTRLRFDPVRPETGELHVVVNITSADMGSEDLHEGMRTAEWFDTARFAQADASTQEGATYGDRVRWFYVLTAQERWQDLSDWMWDQLRFLVDHAQSANLILPDRTPLVSRALVSRLLEKPDGGL